MMSRMRMGSKYSTHLLFAAISCFQINSVFSVSTPRKGILNPFLIIYSSTFHFHFSNQPTLKRQDLHYAFQCIANIDEAVTLFHYMLQMKPPPSVHDYNSLLHSLVKMEHHSQDVKMEHYSQVVYMFKKMSALGCPVNEYTMSIVVNCYAHLREVYLSFAVIGAFLKRGYAPDIVTFNCLIKGFFLRGKVGEAVGLFKKLIRGDLCEVSEITLLSVLDGLSKSGNVVDAVELLRLTEENDDWKVDVRGYNAVIDGLCKGRMLKDGMELIFRMVDRDVLPDVISYNCLLHGLCMNGKLDVACSIFSDLPTKGICPDVFTYTVIIQGFCREALFRNAKEVLEEMERLGCCPNYVTYNVIIQGCLNHLDSSDSINLLKQIVGRDFQLNGPSFFLLLRQMQVLRQMKDGYDDAVINQLILKLVSSDAIHDIQDPNDELRISNLISRLESSNSKFSMSQKNTHLV